MLVVIPKFDAHGYLPTGEHVATWSELEETFGKGVKRKFLIRNLHYVIEQLIKHGVSEIYIDGSFTTAKERPGDVDVAYKTPAGANSDTWGEVSFANHNALKTNYFVDLWPLPSPQLVNGTWVSIKQFFCQKDGQPRGIIRLDLEDFS